MGPVLVASMVQAGVGEASSNKVHPFFTKPTPTDAASQATPTSHATDTHVQHTPIQPDHGFNYVNQFADPGQVMDYQMSDVQPTHAVFAEPMPLDPMLTAAFEPGPIAPSSKPVFDIFKKRETDITSSSTAAFGVAPQTFHSTNAVPPLPPLLAEQPPSAYQATINANDMQPPASERKVLKFNLRTGTLGSPPKPKAPPKPTRLVTLRYGTSDESRQAVGEKVTAILNGTILFPTTPPKATKRKAQKRKEPAQDPKTKHPFFAGKKNIDSRPTTPTPAKPTKAPQKPRHTVFMSTPVSPRKPRNTFTSSKMAQFGTKSAGMKEPGSMYPMWPAQGMNHIRGLTPESALENKTIQVSHLAKKSKGHKVIISSAESVVSQVRCRLDIDGIKRSLPKDDHSFLPPPPQLRLPTRHFESGKKLRRRIRNEIHSNLPTHSRYTRESSPDELALEKPAPVHPAVVLHWNSLETQLSAFDRSTCEGSAWTQKYAPKTAAQVLQSGQEILILKQWLEKLKVLSVESGNGDGKTKSKTDDGHKKKKRKNKVDDFIVNSEDEDSEIDELMEFSDGVQNDRLISKRSLIRGGSLGTKSRLANAILLSGPHGCGKSAAVYAVAKELGFEIFEINSSTRRSGKDILEKVGDMTRNHLVQQHRAQAGNNDDDTMNEVKSGKQATMASFFKAKTTATSKPVPKKPEPSDDKPKVPKAQKQSLILLEEVDVLYEEDKQFWSSLVTMMSQSKRPFIMTCNDESLVPIQTLNLQGIFRLSLPPPSLTVDLCLLLAANEGHALKRSAVESLCKSVGGDLRAAITNLNFWCQLGVGDRRGGFDWFYLRWPKGTDLDESGDVVRVVSEDTYQKGMGWVGRDLLVSEDTRCNVEEASICQSWNAWGQDLVNRQTTSELCRWAASTDAQDPRTRLQNLKTFEAFSVAMSDADLCARGGFANSAQERLDASVPDMQASVRDDYIIGRTLLDAEPANYSYCDSQLISASIQSLARQRLERQIPTQVQSFPMMGEASTVGALDASFARTQAPLTRYDIAVAFDAIAVSPKSTPSTHLDPSVFDRNTNLIVLDVAPWVRSITIYDEQLMQGRMRLNNLLNEGGGRKRMRTTRAAYSALEGGERSTTRRDYYFGGVLHPAHVMRTAGAGWTEAAERLYAYMMERARLAAEARLMEERRLLEMQAVPVDPMLMNTVLGE
ncbi:hypothetical protein VHEMI07522 [[Torrubiella] hemipterigena]|uniref:AAA+ ATPase domain-containing protein n=1 Tax=[Torrubiella] hemipterigena TaxID=1531966 RepID=A0A0A1TAP1_9HYPO|nr:hypothetical protein VHEMI07522 [[Torrubiella] hemipterigena]